MRKYLLWIFGTDMLNSISQSNCFDGLRAINELRMFSICSHFFHHIPAKYFYGGKNNNRWNWMKTILYRSIFTFWLLKLTVIRTTCVDCNAILTTVVSINCKLGFLRDAAIKSSVRISSTRLRSPDDNSINVPLEKFDDLSLLVLFVLIVAPLMPLLLPPFTLAGNLKVTKEKEKKMNENFWYFEPISLPEYTQICMMLTLWPNCLDCLFVRLISLVFGLASLYRMAVLEYDALASPLYPMEF